jgi:hypothetical protein
MATKVTTATNSKNEFIITAGETKYAFRHPKGRDLVSIERGLNDPSRTEAENLALVMSTLSDTDEDEYLDLPLGVFKAVGIEVMNFFRLASD